MLEKLTELIGGTRYGENDRSTVGDNFQRGFIEKIAAHLIANGVTVQQWIPVTERLPKPGQEIIVYDGGVQKPKVFAYQFWNKEYDSWARITHWMPLPQAPGEMAHDEPQKTARKKEEAHERKRM